MTWIDDAASDPVADVAGRLGFEVRRSPSSMHCACPVCGAERRHTRSRDRRGAVGIPNERPATWRCFQCDAGGDAVDFASHHIGGRRFRELGDERKREVREWFGGGSNAMHTSARPAARARAAAEKRAAELLRQLQSPELPAPTYPPASEVAALWGACVRVDVDPTVSDWLKARRIDPIAVADADLARALPAGADVSWWANTGRPWSSTGHRLVVPMYDAHGRMRSVLARRVVDGETPKSVALRGYSRAGLVLACGLGRQLLSTGQRPEWWGRDELRIEVAEGEKKFMMRVARHGDAQEHAPAVIGIESGSWTAEIAARIPDESTVYVATDPDDAGAKCASAILSTLTERIASGRVRVELHGGLEMAFTDRGIAAKAKGVAA